MRIDASELQKFVRTVPPAPPPIEPLLTPEEEARAIADRKRDDPMTHARRERVRTLLRRPAPPEGADAALVALLAFGKALPLEGDADRLDARTRLAEIGRMKDPPPQVREVQRRLRLDPGQSQAFADALIPPLRSFSAFRENDPTGFATSSGGDGS